jgi:molybdopterin-guanine dinucleotide biosynthesis protein
VRPVIIGIGGSHSGAGKTSVATLILKSFHEWGAIKYTKTSLYASIVDDLAVISEEGKDTKKFLDAGAGGVIWVKSPYSELREILPVAVGMLAHLEGIIIEGNSPIEIIQPDVVIFVSGSEEKTKKSAEKILQVADIVIFGSLKPPETPRHAILFERNKSEELIQYLSALVKNFRKNIE